MSDARTPPRADPPGAPTPLIDGVRKLATQYREFSILPLPLMPAEVADAARYAYAATADALDSLLDVAALREARGLEP